MFIFFYFFFLECEDRFYPSNELEFFVFFILLISCFLQISVSRDSRKLGKHNQPEIDVRAITALLLSLFLCPQSDPLVSLNFDQLSLFSSPFSFIRVGCEHRSLTSFIERRHSHRYRVISSTRVFQTHRPMYTIKQDPDALDLTNRPQHLLSPSIDNEDDEEYLHSEDEQPHDHLPETSGFVLKVWLIKRVDSNETFLSFRRQPMIVVLWIQVMKMPI